jgi:hypothetical protein
VLCVCVCCVVYTTPHYTTTPPQHGESRLVVSHTPTREFGVTQHPLNKKLCCATFLNNIFLHVPLPLQPNRCATIKHEVINPTKAFVIKNKLQISWTHQRALHKYKFPTVMEVKWEEEMKQEYDCEGSCTSVSKSIVAENYLYLFFHIGILY